VTPLRAKQQFPLPGIEEKRVYNSITPVKINK
jgi:hypothetical protein